MLEVIGSIVLGYYLVMGVALLVFLAWGCIDDRRYAKRRRRETRAGDDTQVQPGREAERDTPGEAKQAARPPDNVVKFRRDK